MELKNRTVVVIGGSRGVGRAIVGAAHAQGAKVVAVARNAEPLAQVALDLPGVTTLELDATEEDAPSRVFETALPDVLVLCGGTHPFMAPLTAQTWESFSLPWNGDVKASFLFCQAALQRPLKPGSQVVLISSGAALGGSPVSGGYAGAKRMEMLLAQYSQRESERAALGLRFMALAPLRIMAQTELGQEAVRGYSEYLGITPAEFIARIDSAPTPSDIAEAFLALIADSGQEGGQVFGVSSEGMKLVSL